MRTRKAEPINCKQADAVFSIANAIAEVQTARRTKAPTTFHDSASRYDAQPGSSGDVKRHPRDGRERAELVMGTHDLALAIAAEAHGLKVIGIEQ